MNNEIRRKIELHSFYTIGSKKGVCADLSYHDLSGADLSGIDLTDINLGGANLSNANLSYTDLSNASLCHADLRDANLKGADLRDANLRYADLRYAGLRGANLRSADLYNADLREVIGNNKEVKTLQLGQYPIVITIDKMFIGCKIHEIDDWMSFDDQTIDNMDSKALQWWKINKPILKTIIDSQRE